MRDIGGFGDELDRFPGGRADLADYSVEDSAELLQLAEMTRHHL